LLEDLLVTSRKANQIQSDHCVNQYVQKKT